ncbi:hypothetical protein COEREDRAFT_85020 [Coemansia reversa NRRL 1564]|uniref:Uncharacterized protein n=1 Tax=Coemansia reversa (strain ATCC 12441 / NRRL 1564) TaxID=763665 RepID=A0A2G5BHP6_COERN|nr:hypothetical protein COEREDRAFT_85020 [Coemansia reversa NRRL 1564]|eukprot:PIA18540.1 hypothetical protein COEREDRAFT_85020 [Coemansia reversa NRRL 1564]
MAITARRQSRGRVDTGRVASWARNNWTETETREVMEILVDEFIQNEFTTQAYSKSHAPDARFASVSFRRPGCELYNKVQNLRQRFFTPHSYLLRWATSQSDARAVRRAEKSLRNSKTRESVDGMFDRQVSGHEGTETVKSVNYYRDIFRKRAPDVWRVSEEAYVQFVASDRQCATDAAEADSSVDSSTAVETVTETAQGSEVDDSSELRLEAVSGHSWHKFLWMRTRWESLGLKYTSKEDWERRELGFLVQHALTLGDAAGVTELRVVPQFVGTFDAANIELSVARAAHVRKIGSAGLVEELRGCLRFVDGSEHFTMLSLCWLTDRATHRQTTLALLVSYGGGLSGGQRFGVFPHNNTMLAGLVAGQDGLWHEYGSLAGLGASPCLVQQIPPTPELADEPVRVAFSYAQTGFRYTFFVRRRGHFFEIVREDEWLPTMVPAPLRAMWGAARLPYTTLLGLLRHDTDKLLTAMVDLFGLRVFCFGFFDALVAAAPRRASDDRPRRNPSLPRMRRARASASALPYRRTPQISVDSGPAGESVAVPHTSSTSAATLNAPPPHALPFFSPQVPLMHALPSGDMSMSASLPNSPFFRLPLDNGLLMPGRGTRDAAQLFPSLSDASLAATSAAALLPDAPLGGLASIAAASTPLLSNDPLVVNMYPRSTLAGMAASMTPDTITTPPSVAAAVSPAFWDVGGLHHMQPPVCGSTLAVPGLHSAVASAIGSPYASRDESMIAAVAAMELDAQVAMELDAQSAAASVSVTICPPPTSAAWDDSAAQTLSSMLASPDILQSIVQPSPAPTNYNLSAHATPVFDTFSVSPAAGPYSSVGLPVTTPVMADAATTAAAASAAAGIMDFTYPDNSRDPSSMAAYFGVAATTGLSSLQEITAIPDTHLSLEQLKMFSMSSDYPQLDANLPTSCSGR